MNYSRKKISGILFSLLFVFLLSVTLSFLGGCNDGEELTRYLSEYKSDVFEGKSENYSLKASYGFYESPINYDGTVGNKTYLFIIRMQNKETDNVNYTVSFDFDGKNYKKELTLSPTYDALSAEFNIDGFNLKEIPVLITAAEKTEEVVLKSVVPENAMSIDKALLSVKEKTTLFDNLSDGNGGYNMELTARIIVKNDKPYYYIGVTDKNGKMKALLVDAVSGDVLATRDVF